MALQAQFADWGATVLSASCVANVPIDAEQFDLIFADFHLDHEDNGIQATSFLRQRYQAMIPAILSSADRSDQIRELAAEAEMAYLPKPVKGPALKRLVVSLLQRNLSI